MTIVIKTKNSTTTTTAPSSLAQGELAVNITDKKLWVGNAAGTPVQILGSGATNIAGGSNTQVQYNSSGALAGSSNMTFDGTKLTLANDASINGLTVGKGGGAVSSNTAVGASALSGSTSGAETVAIGQNAIGGATYTGTNNTAVGNAVLYPATSASYNTGIGHNSLRYTTTGSYNVASGYYALVNNTTGGNNTALGTYALQSNTTASNNTAVGYQAGYSNTTADKNTALGTQALYSNTTAANNTAVGYQSLFTNTTGQQNTANGYLALYSNTTGGNNVAMGQQALAFNTTASNNTAVGYQAGYSLTTGTPNTAIGYQAMYSGTGQTNTTAIGYQALNSLSGTPDGNTGVGGFALSGVTTGAYNTALGYAAGISMTTGSKNTIIGRYSGNQGGLDIRTASNYIVLSDGDGNPRQIIDNNGYLYLNTTSQQSGTSVANIACGSGSNAIGISGATTTAAGISINATQSGGYLAFFKYTGTQVGSITTNSVITAYNTTSDYRLKDITGNLTGYKERIMALQPKQGSWKADGSEFRGFLAHEFASQYPTAVSGEKDAIDEEGNPKYQGMQAGGSETIADLVALAQEQQAIIQSLTARIEILENK